MLVLEEGKQPIRLNFCFEEGNTIYYLVNEVELCSYIEFSSPEFHIRDPGKIYKYLTELKHLQQFLKAALLLLRDLFVLRCLNNSNHDQSLVKLCENSNLFTNSNFRVFFQEELF